MDPLALFDLDETLIALDSDHAWGEFIVDQKLVNAQDYRKRNRVFYEQYKSGTLDAMEYYRFSSEVLKHHSLDVLHQAREQFVNDIIRPAILPEAVKLIDHHREKNHCLIVITATLEFITQPIVELLNIPHLIAPVPEMIKGKYTGNISGTPSFREGKVLRIKEWLSGQSKRLESAYFYSDSINDLPLLEIVGNPVVVDPDPRLAAIARERQWKIISLGKKGKPD